MPLRNLARSKMKATWQDDLEALREERRLILQNLHILRQRAIKEGQRVSISTYHEIEDTQAKLKEVEDAIKAIRSRHTDVALQSERSPFEESPYTGLASSPSKVEPNMFPTNSLKKTIRNGSSARVNKNQPLLFLFVTIVLLAMVVLVFRGSFLGKVGKNIPIQLDYYHLGDAPISQFHNVYPNNNPFIARFDIARPINAAQLSLTVSHIDPDAKQSPTKVVINGNFVCYLNLYVNEENLRPETIIIPINSEILVVGTNEIKVEVQSTFIEYGQPNLDDFEFWDLKLIIK